MSTKNEKVSAYLPPHIHEKFELYKNDNNLGSSSKALISIIAQFLSIESSIKTTGITLNEFQDLKAEVNKLKELFTIFNENNDFIFKEPLSILLNRLPEIVKNIDDFSSEFDNLKNKYEKLEYQLNKYSIDCQSDQLDIEKSKEEIVKEDLSILTPSFPSSPLSILPSITLSVTGYQLARRLDVNKDIPAGKKKTISRDKFYEWSKEKDIDEIGWIPDPTGAKGYIPKDELESELLKKLQEWIEQDNSMNSGLKIITAKSKTQKININRLLNDTTESLQGDLSIT